MKIPWGIVVVCALILVAVIISINMKSERDDNEETTPLSEFQTTELHNAVVSGELTSVKELISNGADIESMNTHGDTALMIAVQYNHIDIARWLLTQGAKMSYEYKREETAEARAEIEQQYKEMMLATASSQEEIFKDLPDDLREEILSEASQAAMQKDMVDLHFEKESMNVIEFCTSLPMLKLLVDEYGADLDYVDSSGYWPLSSFAESDDINAVKWLLENKADPNKTSTGETAIYKAIQNNNLAMVKLFLKHGASLDVVDVDLCGPFLQCESVEMAKLLLENGADPLVRDQADFPCWYFIDDLETKNFIEHEAKKRGFR